jgi:hypothetical protein
MPLRLFARPPVTIVAVLILGIGTGANTAIFSDKALLRYAASASPERDARQVR